VLYVQTFGDLVTFNPQIRTLIDDADVIERTLRHLDRWDATPEALPSSGPDSSIPKGETLPLTYHPVPYIA
jgi:hypothetical protein